LSFATAKNTHEASKLVLKIGGPSTFFFLNMAFQFVALDHSFSTLVVLPLFFSTWPFNLWPFTIHSQNWWPFQFFSQYGLSFCGLLPFIHPQH
jgi:hypothetical protein